MCKEEDGEKGGWSRKRMKNKRRARRSKMEKRGEMVNRER